MANSLYYRELESCLTTVASAPCPPGADRPQLCSVLSLYYFTGAKKLVEKIKEYNPKIAVFNGKGIYEVFSGEKEFIFGKQPQKIADTETVNN